MDKLKAWEKYHYDILFVGSDWQGTDKWKRYEAELKLKGSKVVYLPYTQRTSSTILQNTLKRFNGEVA